MGHHISAVILRGPFDEERAKSFGFTAIKLTPELTMFPLDAGYCDYWAEKLDVLGSLGHRPLLNSRVIHHMVNLIAAAPLFAIIETDYFGGRGSQAAAVYRGGTKIMAPKETPDGTFQDSIGPINTAHPTPRRHCARWSRRV